MSALCRVYNGAPRRGLIVPVKDRVIAARVSNGLETTMDELLTSQEVARIRKCPELTIRKERMLGRGIPFVKIGRSVRYRRADVEAFFEANLHTHTIKRGAA